MTVLKTSCAPRISFVLPCLNEAATIEACIKECFGALQESGVYGEVIVVDNGSSDGSQEIAVAAGARLVHASIPGYGSALMTGICAAKGKYVLMGDSDRSYDFGQMPRFLEKLEGGFDLVVGCRMPRGGGDIQPKAMPALHRWVGNPVLSFLGRIFFHSDIIDFHCGIRGFDRAKVSGLGLKTPGMEFASEMIVKASLAHLKVGQVPVTLRPDGRSRPPHLKTWRDGWRHLRFMLLHAPRWLFLYPGYGIMSACLVLFLTLLFGPIRVGEVRFDTNTLMFSSLGILIGFQVSLFGAASEIISSFMGLIPRTKLVNVLLRPDMFEAGLLSGGSVFFTAFGCLIAAMVKWKQADFGDLTYPDTLRLTIPAVTGMALGVQLAFGGALVAVLRLNEPRQLNSQ